MKAHALKIGKAMRAALLVLLLNVVGLTNALAQSFTVGDLNYVSFYDNTAIVIGHVDGQNATGALVIPETVTYEGIALSVRYINDNAFSGCNGLTSLSFGSSITWIGEDAFQDCVGLNAVYYTGDIGQWCNIHYVYGPIHLWQNPLYFAHNLYIDNELVTDLVIPENVTEIPSYAFIGATCLTSLTVSNSVTTIGECAFHTCSGLTGSLTIGNSVTTIGNGAFYGCNGIDAVYYTGSISQWCNIRFPWSDSNPLKYAHNLYIDNELVTDLVIPETVTRIYSYAFYGATCLTSVIIGDSVTSIDVAAFSECRGLTSLTIGNSVTNIGDYAFYYCTNFTGSLIIPNSVTSIGMYAFSYCNGVNAIYYTGNINQWCNIQFRGIESNPLFFAHNLYIDNELVTDLVIPETVTEISNAFYGITCLISLRIPNSVTRIGNYAFHNSINLESITVCVETPPILGYRVFEGVNKSIPIYVPCGAINYYTSASGWNEFTNYQEIVPYQLSINPSNSDWGIAQLTEEPDCEDATTIVTAIANEGYAFANWTEDGEIVSNDPVYSFTLESDRNLVANFVPTTNHYIPQGSAYSETMALYGVIQIDGVEQHSGLLEVGAFCGDECRGSAIASEFEITHRYLAILNIFGESGHQLTFKLYDHGLGEELELTSPAAITFDVDGYGNPIEPYVLNFTSSVAITATLEPAEAGTVTGTGDYAIGDTCTLTATANEGYQFKNWTLNGEVVSTEASYSFTVSGEAAYVAHFHYVHTQALATGWNWWSTYIEQEGIDGLEMLENSIGIAGVRIQGRDGITDQFEYQGTNYWYGSLNAIANEQMYKIRTNADCNAVIVGDLASPSNHPITISNGWNWIGYPCGQSQSLDEVMSGFTPEANDVIKGRNGSSTFISYGSYNFWYGTLTVLEPGQGYMYKSNGDETKTLTFQTERGNAVGNAAKEDGFFTPNTADYSSNMLVTAVVEMDGQELRSEEYELAAFVGDECRGSVRLMYVEPLDRYVAFLLVYGDEPEEVRFVLTDGNEVVCSGDCLTYAPDSIEGTPTEPVTLHFGTLGLNESGQDVVNIFPNPSNGVFGIEGKGVRKIEVVDAYGQMILSKETQNDFERIDLSDKADGLYLLRVVTSNGITTKQLIKK